MTKPGSSVPAKLTKKAFREFLNFNHARTTAFRNGPYQQRTRMYGDYLYAQDREMFNVEYKAWVERGGKA